MKCMKCGNEVSEKIEKCPICGTGTEYSSTYYHIQNEKNPNKGGNGCFVLLFFLLLIIGIIVFIFIQLKETHNSKPETPKVDAVDTTKRSVAELNARNYINAVETYAMYTLMDENEMPAGIYAIKDETVKPILNQIQVRSELPIDGWFALSENRLVVAAELQFKSYTKGVIYTSSGKSQAVLKKISKTPTSIEDAIKQVEEDLK